MSKDARIGIRLTDEQYEFLSKQSEKEFRTITSIVNLALKKLYPDYPVEKKKNKAVQDAK